MFKKRNIISKFWLKYTDRPAYKAYKWDLVNYDQQKLENFLFGSERLKSVEVGAGEDLVAYFPGHRLFSVRGRDELPYLGPFHGHGSPGEDLLIYDRSTVGLLANKFVYFIGHRIK